MTAPAAYPFQSLGFVNVTTAGTPAPLSATSLKVRGITVAAFKSKGVANSGGNMYILDSAGNVLFVVPKNQTVPLPLSNPQLSEMIDVANLYLDADSNGDGALISVLL